jgi:hypothetical protein
MRAGDGCVYAVTIKWRMRLPANPPPWMEELYAFVTDEKGCRHVELKHIKKHWSEFRQKKAEAAEEEGKEKRPAPTPEESLGRALGRLTKKKKAPMDLEVVRSSVREHCGTDEEANASVYVSIGDGLGTSGGIRTLYRTFQERADTHSVCDDVREPVSQMVSVFSPHV